jgi:chromosome segregation ATPase
MSWRFIRNLIGVRTRSTINNCIEALVRIDPRGAIEAELQTMEDQLDQLGIQVAEARVVLEQRRKEANCIKELYNQRLYAAESIESKINETSDDIRRLDLEQSLTTLVNMLEKMGPDIEHEVREAQEAQEFLQVLEKTYAETGSKLKAARLELERAKRDMTRSEHQKAQAEHQAEQTRHTANLANAGSSVSIALRSMQDITARNLQQAEALKSKTALLQLTCPEQDDPNITAALAEKENAPQVPGNISARLAALRQRL